jgi:CelD/BcsL family acetyltransferase involved in cellulose biosynthesis
MTVTAQRDNDDQSIIFYQFSRDWTWDELLIAINRARVLQDSVNHRVDMILDMRDIAIPDGVENHQRILADIRHPNTSVRVVGMNGEPMMGLFRTFTRTYRKVADFYETAFTLEEAYQVIETRQERDANGQDNHLRKAREDAKRTSRNALSGGSDGRTL